MSKLSAKLFDLGDIRLAWEEESSLKATQVRVSTMLAGMNPGTYLAHYAGLHPRMRDDYVPLRHPRKKEKFPRYLRGFGVGRVIEVGKEVEGIEEGDLLQGMMDYSPETILDTGSFRKVSEDNNLEEYALKEQAMVALNAIHRSGLTLGDDVVVIGQGPIGLGVTQMANLAGANLIIANDLYENRLAIAKELGAAIPL